MSKYSVPCITLVRSQC